MYSKICKDVEVFIIGSILFPHPLRLQGPQGPQGPPGLTGPPGIEVRNELTNDIYN